MVALEEPKYFAEKTELGLERRKSAVGLAQEAGLSVRGEQSLKQETVESLVALSHFLGLSQRSESLSV